MNRLHPTLRDLRLGSGLVLFTYIATHLANHALGLVSVALAERALRYAVLVWHSWPGTLLLYGAAAVHVGLAFVAIYRRRTLRMPPVELLRIVLGLGIPVLLIGHAIGTRVAWEAYDVSATYTRVVWNLWKSDSEGRQLALLVPGWLHGCLGVHYAFVRRAAYRRLQPVFFAVALLLPVLAGIGFITMARALAADVDHHALFQAAIELDDSKRIALARMRDTVLTLYFVAIAAVFGAREIRALIERRNKSTVAVTYPHRAVRIPRGWTVLEASRAHHIPHVSMCGGRARCSTCRVRVTAGIEGCPAPETDELATLARIGAPADVRLACQLRPDADIAVVPLLAAASAPTARTRGSRVAERDVALVAVQWRNRAELARMHLAPDFVFMSKAWSETVGGIVAANGGTEADALGDGIVAVFGLHTPLPEACRRALAAAAAIEDALRHLGRQYAREFKLPADFALCVHAGHAAIGAIGISEPRRPFVAGAAVESLRALQVAAPGEAFIVSTAVVAQSGLARDAIPGFVHEAADVPASGPAAPGALPART